MEPEINHDNEAKGSVHNGRCAPEDVETKSCYIGKATARIFLLERKGDRQTEQERKNGSTEREIEGTDDRIGNTASFSKIIPPLGSLNEHGETQGRGASYCDDNDDGNQNGKND